MIKKKTIAFMMILVLLLAIGLWSMTRESYKSQYDQYTSNTFHSYGMGTQCNRGWLYDPKDFDATILKGVSLSNCQSECYNSTLKGKKQCYAVNYLDDVEAGKVTPQNAGKSGTCGLYLLGKPGNGFGLSNEQCYFMTYPALI